MLSVLAALARGGNFLYSPERRGGGLTSPSIVHYEPFLHRKRSLCTTSVAFTSTAPKCFNRLPNEVHLGECQPRHVQNIGSIAFFASESDVVWRYLEVFRKVSDFRKTCQRQ